MKIEIGKTNINKTSRFLIPAVNSYCKTFISFYNSLFKLGFGIHDTLLDGSPLIVGNNIYILFDISYKNEVFHEFLEWVKGKEYYIADYSLEVDLKKQEKYMIVLTVPEDHNEDYKNFLVGNYSKMYTNQFRVDNFLNKGRLYEYAILTKDPTFLPTLANEIEKEFDVEIGDDDWGHLSGKELLLPLKKSEEVFNCKPGQRVFFNEELDKVWQN